MFKFLKNFKIPIPFFKKSKKKVPLHIRSAGEIDFVKFQNVIHYKILNKDYFITALTHRSYIKLKKNSEPAGLLSNERLEFLGDAVLDLVVAEYLYYNFPQNEEGDLTKFRSILVNKRFLAERAKNIKLQEFILASYTAMKSIEEGYDSILADAYESIIGAIFLDSGYEAAKEFINEEIFIKLDIKWLDEYDENHKSKLLEFAQANTNYIPEYKVMNEEGPEHNKLFTVDVYIDGQLLGTGEGKSKKQAEQQAAKNALLHVHLIKSTKKNKKNSSKK